MTYAAALEQIQQYCAADKDPVLDEPVLAMLARKAARGAAVSRTDSDYASEQSVARSVLEGWRLKMGLAAEQINFGDVAGQSFDRKDRFDHCEKMVKQWQDRCKEIGAFHSPEPVRIGKITAPDTSKLVNL